MVKKKKRKDLSAMVTQMFDKTKIHVIVDCSKYFSSFNLCAMSVGNVDGKLRVRIRLLLNGTTAYFNALHRQFRVFALTEKVFFEKEKHMVTLGIETPACCRIFRIKQFLLIFFY